MAKQPSDVSQPTGDEFQAAHVAQRSFVLLGEMDCFPTFQFSLLLHLFLLDRPYM